MKHILHRLVQMLLGWGFVGLIYRLADQWQAAGVVLSPGWIDTLIPFSPMAVWPYLSFFALLPMAYLGCPHERLQWLRTSMQLSALCAGLVFVLWPTTLAYPVNPGAGISAAVLNQLIRIDSAQNCLPSLHMALSVLAIQALHDRRRPWRNALLWAWGALIAFSVIQLRRHLFIDLVAGTGLGLGVGWLCRARCYRAPSTHQGVTP